MTTSTPKPSFEALIAATRHSALAAIRSHLNDTLVDFIDDVLQETYYNAYSRLMKTKLSDVKKLEHYIFVIAKNECIRLNKREKKYTAIQNERTELYEDNATTFDAIIPIILGLPTQYVEVAKRFYIEGLSMIEIGTQLKLSRQAIKTRLFRSRKLIIKQAKQMGLT